MASSFEKLILLGHRGARKYAPENTFEAFDLALAHGCDGFELDVRLTADRVGLICHDPKYKRRSLADCGARAFDGLPKIDQVVEHYSQRAFINVELKVEGLHEHVLRAYADWKPARFLVSSFLPSAITKLHALKAEFPLGLICQNKEQLAPWRDLPIEAVMAHASLVTEKLRSATAQEKKKLFVWTVNRASDMRRFAAMGVDGLISDDTVLLAKTFGRSPDLSAAAPD